MNILSNILEFVGVLLVLVALAKGPRLDEVRKESSLRHLVQQGDVLAGVAILPELLEVEEVTRIKEYIFRRVRRIL